MDIDDFPYPKGSEACGAAIDSTLEQKYVQLTESWSKLPEETRVHLLEQLEKNRDERPADAYLHFFEAMVKLFPVGWDREANTAQVKAKTKKKKSAEATNAQLSIPYPVDMTRCSPFFPVPYVRRKDQAKILPYLNDWPLAANAWGTLTYKGPTLATAHEDLLVALLALVQAQKASGNGDDCTYSGSLRELLIATGCKQPNGQEYEDAFDQLADLAGAVVSVLNTKGRRMAFASLITGGKREDEQFKVQINPEFLRAYQEGRISYQSLHVRSKIKSLVGRALYRFVAGQSGVWKGNVTVLCGALNLKCDEAGRKKLRRAINELVELKVLRNGSGLSGSTVALRPIGKG